MCLTTAEICVNINRCSILIIDASSEFCRVDLRNILWTRTQLGPSFDERPALQNSRIMPEFGKIFGDFMNRAQGSHNFSLGGGINCRGKNLGGEVLTVGAKNRQTLDTTRFIL